MKATNVIEISNFREVRNKAKLQKGKVLTVERLGISGLLQTENETSNGEWEENILFIYLKSISKYGFQVSTSETKVPDQIGVIIFDVQINGSEELLDIDAIHQGEKTFGNGLLLNFKYRSPLETSVHKLLTAATA